MKDTEEKQDVKKQVSDKIRPLHRLTQVQMQLPEPQKTAYFCVPQLPPLHNRYANNSIYPNSCKDWGNVF